MADFSGPIQLLGGTNEEVKSIAAPTLAYSQLSTCVQNALRMVEVPCVAFVNVWTGDVLIYEAESGPLVGALTALAPLTARGYLGPDFPAERTSTYTPEGSVPAIFSAVVGAKRPVLSGAVVLSRLVAAADDNSQPTLIVLDQFQNQIQLFTGTAGQLAALAPWNEGDPLGRFRISKPV